LILDYIKEDSQLQEYIDENEKIIEKYHRKMNEIFQLMKDNIDQEKEIQWSPISLDYKQKEDEEKKSCDEKKRKLMSDNPINHTEILSDDKGIFL
jgi:predicted RNase H-like nuclease (RuvC/YqgF family)